MILSEYYGKYGCGEFAKILTKKTTKVIYGISLIGDYTPAHYVVLIQDRFVDVNGMYDTDLKLLSEWRKVAIDEEWTDDDPKLKLFKVDFETLNNPDYICDPKILNLARQHVNLIDNVSLFGIAASNHCRKQSDVCRN